MEVKTRKVNCKITDKDGTVIFQKDQFEVPEDWSDTAAIIMASKYATDDEYSFLDIVDRVVDTITAWGLEQGYFKEKTVDSFEFSNKLKEILINQRAAFNSPVFFNCGVPKNPNAISACFILPLEDTMEDILAHNIRTGIIFKGGGGAGYNISNLRAKGEKLSNKGSSSGPISFMRMWDACAASVRSGGKNRRSSTLIVMDTNHPDIEEFIECKKIEEDKAKFLVSSGLDYEEAYATVDFQNANHSVMVTDEFMQAVEEDKNWQLKGRVDKCKDTTIKAKDLFNKIAQIAWETGDPGIFFYNRTNRDNPVPSLGDIRSGNPCNEYLSIPNSSCNLSSLNLVKYQTSNSRFDYDLFKEDIKTMITAMDILIEAADYPTPEVRETTIKTRPLGLGFSNLGAFLMLQGLAYDSKEGRELASHITQTMTTYAYETSIELAEKLDSFPAFENNKVTCAVIADRLLQDDKITGVFGKRILEKGLRNSQLTLLAPTGTIGIMMDCDTLGIEPLFALRSTKQLSGGGTIEFIPKCVEQAVNNLQEANVWDRETAINLVIPQLSKDKQDIFKTANEIHWKDHILMVAACLQSLNGSISKTINMPADATVEDVKEAYMFAWKQGLKGITIYRDGSKAMQPLKSVEPEEDIKKATFETKEEVTIPAGTEVSVPVEDKWSVVRKKLSDTRHALIHKFCISGFEAYLIVGMYEDGTPGELFIEANKEGSTLNGLMDGFAKAISLSLQYGVPLEKLIDKFTQDRFEPAGLTGNKDIPIATSILDYIFKWLKITFIEDEDESEDQTSIVPLTEETNGKSSGQLCSTCGSLMIQAGSCFYCSGCGSNSGGCS